MLDCDGVPEAGVDLHRYKKRYKPLVTAFPDCSSRSNPVGRLHSRFNTMTALILLGLILCVVTALAAFSPRGLLSWLLGLLGRESLLPPSSVKSDVEKKPSSESWPPIEPLPDFDWKTTPPIKLRPFKPIYHINMGMFPPPHLQEVVSPSS